MTSGRFSTVHVSTSSNVNVRSGQAVISVNGRTFRADACDAVSVRVVSGDSGTYIEITDKHGRTRRVFCEE